jgi:signal transduction histidine kinase
MTRSVALALTLAAAALAAIAVGTTRVVRSAQRELVASVERELVARVADAERLLEEDLNAVVDHLHYAAEISRYDFELQDRDDMTRDLQALVALGRHYRAATLFDGAGRRVVSVTNPRNDAVPAEDAAEVAAHAARARGLPEGTVQISPALRSDPSGWECVFAAPVGKEAVLALTVDTESLFARLRATGFARTGQLLVISSQGAPTVASSAGLLEAARRPNPPPSLTALIARMQAGARGTVRLDGADAEAIGLPHAEARAAFASIEVRDAQHWSVALVASTADVQAQQRGVIGKLLAGAAAAGVCVVIIAAFLVRAARRQAELRARLAEADRLAKILESMPAGVIVISDKGRVTSVNRQVRERLPAGVDIVGRPVAEALPDATEGARAKLRALVDEALRAGQVRSLPTARLALYGGGEGQYSLHAVPLEPRFPEARVVLVIEDLSDLRALESQLLRAERLSTVGVLAAGIAHEIGTPLGVVRSRAEYARGKLGADHPQARGLEVIVAEVDRVSRTIRQLLDFARVRPAQAHPVVVAEVAERVRELFHLEAERRRVTLAVDCAAAVQPVMADPDELQQVLINLVMNALDAGARNEVRIEARPDNKTAGGVEWPRVRITVRDDGAGIAPEHLNLVFDPFFTTKKRGQGTGLGLAVAAQIVRNHGGEIEIDSTLGVGTTVTLLWPAARAPGIGQTGDEAA